MWCSWKPYSTHVSTLQRMLSKVFNCIVAIGLPLSCNNLCEQTSQPANFRPM